MFKNYSASKIQYAYQKFLKCERDPKELCKIMVTSLIITKKGTIKRSTRNIEIPSPIDPIYRQPYHEKKRIRIVEWHNGYKSACVWHFNINTLIDWINLTKKWTNPMTNCLFLNETIDRISNFVSSRGCKKKIKTPIIYNQLQIPFGVQLSFVPGINNKLDLLLKYIEENNHEGVEYILITNHEGNNFKLDCIIDRSIYMDETNETIYPVTLFSYAIYLGNIEIINQLIYFGCNIEKKVGKNGYSPLHLCAILGYNQLGRLLIINGANIDEMCKFKGKSCSMFGICDRIEGSDFIEEIMKIN